MENDLLLGLWDVILLSMNMISVMIMLLIRYDRIVVGLVVVMIVLELMNRFVLIMLLSVIIVMCCCLRFCFNELFCIFYF